ncbi:hypothetical protein LH20_17510 [Sphingopyxis sp. 113P3]|nr:hypothetical protein LH20_17510 [Sphingopyxis sp. 113P3]
MPPSAVSVNGIDADKGSADKFFEILDGFGNPRIGPGLGRRQQRPVFGVNEILKQVDGRIFVSISRTADGQPTGASGTSGIENH